MRVVVSLDHRFARTPDGVVHSRFFHYSFWQRYLEVFDQVRVVARVRDVESVPANWKPSSGQAVEFMAVAPYRGPYQYLLNMKRVRDSYRDAVGAGDAVILRAHSQVSSALAPHIQRQHRPYGVEVVGDPYDTFAPGAMRHPLRPLFRWLAPRQLRNECSGAAVAAYVTAEALQRRYPPSPDAFSTHYSSIELTDEWLVEEPRTYPEEQSRFDLVTVGTLDQLYKAPDILIQAVATVVKSGIDLHLTLLGEGRHQSELEAMARQLGIGERIHFAGQVLAGKGVREYLDSADLFVLPSRQEGLPRVIIEAMARGLPCIGSTVGGIPELLPPENLVPPNDVAALANRIEEMVSDRQRLTNESRRNLVEARKYREAILRERRVALYRTLRERTENWLSQKETS